MQSNIDLYNINFIYCWQRAIKLWLCSSSYLRSCLFRNVSCHGDQAVFNTKSMFYMQMLINFLLENQIVHLSLHSHLLMRYLIRFELIPSLTYQPSYVRVNLRRCTCQLRISLLTCRLRYQRIYMPTYIVSYLHVYLRRCTCQLIHQPTYTTIWRYRVGCFVATD